MLVEVIEATLIPGRLGIAQVFIEVQARLQSLGRGRVGGNIVAGVLVGEQIAVGVDRPLVEGLDAIFVA